MVGWLFLSFWTFGLVDLALLQANAFSCSWFEKFGKPSRAFARLQPGSGREGQKGVIMKKIVDFLSSPGLNLFAGIILFLLIGCVLFNYDSFDRMSAFYGGLSLISLDILFYGLNGLLDNRKSKKSCQDLDE